MYYQLRNVIIERNFDLKISPLVVNSLFYSLPIWTSSVYPGGDMEQLVTLAETVRSKTREMSRLRGGFLLKHMVNRMEDKFADKMKLNGTVWLYSGHDTTITTLLTALKLYEVGKSNKDRTSLNFAMI